MGATARYEFYDDEDNPLFPDKDRDLLVKRLAASGLPTREIVRITGTSNRTVARIMQRFGLLRKRPARHTSSRKRHTQRLIDILTQYYAMKEVTLDSMEQLAKQHGVALRKLFALIREHVSPLRWAIRTCLACGQSTLTPSPAARYCPACKKKVKKAREGMDDDLIYE